MASRRAVYAARFLRPPGWTKRLLLREKPRDLTGPYENPVRRWVRLREKARLFSQLPPPRQVPKPKPERRKLLQAVEGVPRVSPDVLQRRLEFLLSPSAVEQQLAEPLRPGLSPYYVEFACWERQMREVRRIYRAQYLQKLAEVTEIERGREEELHRKTVQERRRRKEAHLQRVGEDMKRRAILKDRKRIESKVNEAMEMARRSKLKRGRLYWFRRMENLSKLIASADNLDEALAAPVSVGAPTGAAKSPSADEPLCTSGVFLSRNVSVAFLLRQLAGAKGGPQQKSRRLPHVENVHREILELSYDIMPEDEPRIEPVIPDVPDPEERATQLYSSFTQQEKVALLEQKVVMVERAKMREAERMRVGLFGAKEDSSTNAKRTYQEIMEDVTRGLEEKKTQLQVAEEEHAHKSSSVQKLEQQLQEPEAKGTEVDPKEASLLDEKRQEIVKLKERINTLSRMIAEVEKAKGPHAVTVKLLDQLDAARLAAEESKTERGQKMVAEGFRGADP